MKSSPRARSSRVPAALARLWPLSVLQATRAKPLPVQFPSKLVWREGELEVQCARLRRAVRDRVDWAAVSTAASSRCAGSAPAGTLDVLDLHGALREFEVDLAEAAVSEGERLVPPSIVERWLELRALALRVLGEEAMVRA